MPELKMNTLLTIMSPFTFTLWKLLAVAAVIFVILLWLTWSNGRTCTYFQQTSISDVLTSAISVFGILCQQGQDISSKFWSCRLVLITVYLTAVTMFVAYSATFFSFLTVKRFQIPFTDFQGILDDGTYKLGFLAGSSHENYFKFTNDPLLREIFHKLIKPQKLPNSHLEGFTRMCSENKYAYLGSYEGFKLCEQKLSCEVVELSGTLYEMFLSIPLCKNQPWKWLLDIPAQYLRSTGIIARMERKIFPRSFPENVQEEFGSTLEETSILFLILAIGIIASLGILVAELLFKKLIQNFTESGK